MNILSINLLGRRLSLCITMGCTALFFLLLNICTSRYSGWDYGSCLRVCSAECSTSGTLRSPVCQASNSRRSKKSLWQALLFLGKLWQQILWCSGVQRGSLVLLSPHGIPKHPTSCFLAQSRKLKNVWTTCTGKKLYFSFSFFFFFFLSGISADAAGWH